MSHIGLVVVMAVKPAEEKMANGINPCPTSRNATGNWLWR